MSYTIYPAPVDPAPVAETPIKVGDTVYRREMSNYWKPAHGFITKHTVVAVSPSGQIATRFIKARHLKAGVRPDYTNALLFYRSYEAARAALIAQRQEAVYQAQQTLNRAKEYLADALAVPEVEPV